MTHSFTLVNGDTDSIAFKKPDQKPFTAQERITLLTELNALMPELIEWEDDDYYKRFIVLKAKNYILQDQKGKVKVKGNSLKASNKEKALKRFIGEVVDLLLTDRKEQVIFLYLQYAKQITRIVDISDWCQKATITKAVLEGQGTRQVKMREALGARHIQEGDKFYFFTDHEGALRLQQDYSGLYCADTLLRKLYDTLSVFGNIIDMSMIPNFNLKRNRDLLASI
jgi:DNA polymerase elongation subunit (family B)